MHVHRYDYNTKGGKYYDFNDDYVDLSVKITGIAGMNAKNTPIVSRTYVVLEDGEIVYANPQVYTYIEAGGK